MDTITVTIALYNFYLFMKILVFFYNSIKNLEFHQQYLSTEFKLKIFFGYMSLYYLFNHPLPKIGMYIMIISEFY